MGNLCSEPNNTNEYISVNERPRLVLAQRRKAPVKHSNDQFIESQILRAIEELEEEQGRPVYFVELLKKVIAQQKGVSEPRKPSRMDVLNVMKDDLVLCDAECNMFSLNVSKQRHP